MFVSRIGPVWGGFEGEHGAIALSTEQKGTALLVSNVINCTSIRKTAQAQTHIWSFVSQQLSPVSKTKIVQPDSIDPCFAGSQRNLVKFDVATQRNAATRDVPPHPDM